MSFQLMLAISTRTRSSKMASATRLASYRGSGPFFAVEPAALAVEPAVAGGVGAGVCLGEAGVGLGGPGGVGGSVGAAAAGAGLAKGFVSALTSACG